MPQRKQAVPERLDWVIGPPPVILHSSFFIRFSFEAVKAFAENPPQEPIIETNLYSINSMLLAGPEEAHFGVELDIQTLPEAEAKLPYTLHLTIMGAFEAARHIPKEKWEDIVRVNGTALLYSAAREFVLTATGRGPLPPLTLPTRSFVPISAQAEAPAKEKPGKKRSQ